MFAHAGVNEVKRDVITEDSREELHVHIETRASARAELLAQSLVAEIKNTLEVTPRSAVRKCAESAAVHGLELRWRIEVGSPK